MTDTVQDEKHIVVTTVNGDQIAAVEYPSQVAAEDAATEARTVRPWATVESVPSTKFREDAENAANAETNSTDNQNTEK